MQLIIIELQAEQRFVLVFNIMVLPDVSHCVQVLESEHWLQLDINELHAWHLLSESKA